jgi:hypothetical protein
MGRNSRDRRNAPRYRSPGNVDVGRLLRADSGGDRQLVLECTRGNAVPTHRKSTVTVVMDVMYGAISTSIGPAAVAAQHASGSQVSTDRESEDGRWREWKRKGREEETQFRHTVRTVLVDVAGVVAVGGALWFASVTWL